MPRPALAARVATMRPTTVIVDAWVGAVEDALAEHRASHKCAARCDVADHLAELAGYLAAVADEGKPLPAADVEAWD